jgi:hypothetical protein
VLTVFTINATNTQLDGFAMPISWSAASAAAVRALRPVGGVSVGAAADVKRRSADVAPVCGFTHITDGVLEDAFPGTSAWSPPI